MNSNHSMTNHRKEKSTKNRSLFFFGLLCLAAFALKLVLLYHRKMYIDPDEGYYLLLAQNILDGAGYGFNGLPNIIFPPFLPGLIAALSLLVSEPQIALGLLTALSGVVLGWVAFLMMRQKNLFSIPILTGSLVLFIPALNDFIPAAGVYTKNLYRGSDILNALLVFTAIFFLTQALKKKQDWFFLAAGIILGLAYLTRPEGLLLFFLLAGWLVLLGLLRFIPLSLKRVVLFGCSFILVAAPYILYLKTVTGHWMLSGKIGASQNYRNSLMKVITNEDWRDFSEIHYSLDQNKWEMNDMYWGFNPGLTIDSGFSVTILFKNALENIRLGWKIPLTIFPVYLWLFAIPGLILSLVRVFRRNSSSDLILLVLFPYSLFLLFMTYPIARHHLFLTPVLCVYAVRGIEWTSSLTRQRLGLHAALSKRIFLIIGIIIIALFVGKYLKNFNQSALHHPGFRTIISVEDSMAKYIQERGGRVVMSGHPRMAVRAKSDWQVLPLADLTVALQFAQHKKVDYIVWRYGDGKENLYLLVDVNQSYIPRKSEEKITHQTIDKKHYFELVKILPLADQEGK